MVVELIPILLIKSFFCIFLSIRIFHRPLYDIFIFSCKKKYEYHSICNWNLFFFISTHIICNLLIQNYQIKLPSFLKRIFHIYHFLEKKHFYKKNLVDKKKDCLCSLSFLQQVCILMLHFFG